MDRRPLGDGHALFSPLLEGAGFLAAFTERTGGESPPPFESLNLGLRTEDRPARVLANRRRVIQALDVPPFAVAEQVHGAEVARVGDKRAGAGFEDHDEALPGADALTVTRPGLPVAVLTADCLPIALASEAEGRLVAVHAGWRGLAAGIPDRALTAFEDPEGVVAVIGPAIGPCHYQVGEDVALAVASGSEAGAVVERREDGLFLDLAGTARKILRGAGVRKVEVAGECTAHLPERFFSHRRDGETGRQALVAMRLSTRDNR
ncbi:MAG TPA: peptidoglycan editing factor PgeF [Actinomycetota bacterium]|jgi:hypothetical protein